MSIVGFLDTNCSFTLYKQGRRTSNPTLELIDEFDESTIFIKLQTEKKKSLYSLILVHVYWLRKLSLFFIGSWRVQQWTMERSVAMAEGADQD